MYGKPNPVRLSGLNIYGGGEEEKGKYRATRGHRHLRIEMRRIASLPVENPILKISDCSVNCLYKHSNGITDYKLWLC